MSTNRDFEYISLLIVKFLKNEITDKEQQELDAWLAESADHTALLESFKRTPQIQKDVNLFQQVDVNDAWVNFNNKIECNQQQRKLYTSKWWFHVAALFLVVCSIGFYFYKFQSNSQVDVAPLAYDILPGKTRAILQLADGSSVNLNRSQKHTENGRGADFEVKDGTLYFTSNNQKKAKNNFNALRTPRAGEYKVVLPDGTKVWLNASSFLRFPEQFDGAERRVELKGEAYFEVAHQPSKPFIVSFNDTEVKVLGTHFNINTYGSGSKTTLIEGAVSISEGTQQKLLKPGQEASITAGEISVQKTEVYKSIAWKEGVFYFQEDGIKEVLSQIARWYDVEIVYEGKPGQQTISGNIRRQATLNQVLEMLSTLTNAKFNLKDRIVTVNFNQ